MTREDTFKLTREDVLRELELLPVWKLRAPLPTTPVVESIEPVLTASSPVTDPVDSDVVPNTVVNNEISKTAFLVFSEDKKWLFVLPEILTGESAELFNNILRALKIKPAHTTQTQKLTQDIGSASVVVAMGETVAQQLLNNSNTMDNLRGKQHAVNGVPVIVTYHPDQLLQHLPNKAKTWDDLCMALNALPA